MRAVDVFCAIFGAIAGDLVLTARRLGRRVPDRRPGAEDAASRCSIPASGSASSTRAGSRRTWRGCRRWRCVHPQRRPARRGRDRGHRTAQWRVMSTHAGPTTAQGVQDRACSSTPTAMTTEWSWAACRGHRRRADPRPRTHVRARACCCPAAARRRRSTAALSQGTAGLGPHRRRAGRRTLAAAGRSRQQRAPGARDAAAEPRRRSARFEAMMRAGRGIEETVTRRQHARAPVCRRGRARHGRGRPHRLAVPARARPGRSAAVGVDYVAVDASGCAGAGDWLRRISLTPAGLAPAQARMLLIRGERKRSPARQRARRRRRARAIRYAWRSPRRARPCRSTGVREPGQAFPMSLHPRIHDITERIRRAQRGLARGLPGRHRRRAAPRPDPQRA